VASAKVRFINALNNNSNNSNNTKLSNWLRTVSQKLTAFGRPLQVTVRPMLQDRCPVCLVFNVGVWLDGSRCHLAWR